jgi:hypothetical protein
MTGNVLMSNQRVLGKEVDYTPPKIDLTQAVSYSQLKTIDYN